MSAVGAYEPMEMRVVLVSAVGADDVNGVVGHGLQIYGFLNIVAFPDQTRDSAARRFSAEGHRSARRFRAGRREAWPVFLRSSASLYFPIQFGNEDVGIKNRVFCKH